MGRRSKRMVVKPIGWDKEVVLLLKDGFNNPSRAILNGKKWNILSYVYCEETGRLLSFSTAIHKNITLNMSDSIALGKTQLEVKLPVEPEPPYKEELVGETRPPVEPKRPEDPSIDDKVRNDVVIEKVYRFRGYSGRGVVKSSFPHISV